jgi:hypothetical protein
MREGSFSSCNGKEVMDFGRPIAIFDELLDNETLRNHWCNYYARAIVATGQFVNKSDSMNNIHLDNVMQGRCFQVDHSNQCISSLLIP